MRLSSSRINEHLMDKLNHTTPMQDSKIYCDVYDEFVPDDDTSEFIWANMNRLIKEDFEEEKPWIRIESEIASTGSSITETRTS